MSVDLSIRQRIEKLFVQASDSGCSPAEAEAFEAKALALLAKHRLTKADVTGTLSKDDHLTTQVFEGRAMDGIYGRARISVLTAIARPFDVELFWNNKGGLRRQVSLFGFKSDIEMVCLLANRLIADVDMRVAALPSRRKAHDLIADRRGFYFGYASEIKRRLEEARNTAESEAEAEGVDVKSMALVLVDRKAQVKEALRREHGLMRSSGVTLRSNANSGHEAGKEAGRKADLTTGNGVRGARGALR